MKALICFCFALSLCVHLAAAADNEGHISAHWDETIYPDDALRAARLADFKSLLGASWREKIPVIIKKDERSAGDKMLLQNCQQLFGLERSLYETEDPTDWPALMQSLLRCKAMEIMTLMQPSKVSYLKMDVLPIVPDLAKVRVESRSDQVRSYFSGLEGKANERKCFRKNVCRVATKKNAYILSIVGGGDYNGDGIEDIILIATSGSVRGTPTSALSLGFVVTREGSGKPLKILTTFGKVD
jgi:hypothetical protein